MNGDAAYAALIDAMEQERPLCRGDERYTTPQLVTGADEIEMTETCILCPIRGACEAYRKTAKPKAGFWAGEWGK